jgi:hypothetical protein
MMVSLLVVLIKDCGFAAKVAKKNWIDVRIPCEGRFYGRQREVLRLRIKFASEFHGSAQDDKLKMTHKGKGRNQFPLETKAAGGRRRLSDALGRLDEADYMSCLPEKERRITFPVQSG